MAPEYRSLVAQQALPLLTALQQSSRQPNAPFYAPGHKRGQGIPAPLAELLGAAVFRADLPELPELDNLFAPEGAIREAQALAAAAFGSDRTYFLANGSTCGIQAAVLATCKPGDKLILPRNAHQSAIAALILSGAVPIFVEPEYDEEWAIAHGVRAVEHKGTHEGNLTGFVSVAAALKQHPNAKAVLVVYPTYYGACADVAAIAQQVHHYNIPLIVDEAHGGHFAFHPALPMAALAAGADLVVQSTHKVLGAMTQASMLHLQGNRVDPERLGRSLQLVQSTSPSYLLLASLDAARWQMATQGENLMQQTLELAAIACTNLSQIPHLRLLDCPTPPTSGFTALDPTRITVDVTGFGLTGFVADEILHGEWNVTAELPGMRSLTFMLTLGNTRADIERLTEALMALGNRRQKLSSHAVKRSSGQVVKGIAMAKMTPRQAFFAGYEVVDWEGAIDRISAETICPYPPGIPALIPGERITAVGLDALQQILAMGGMVTGCSDPTLQTFRVVVE